jgi:hypothetical protein
VIGGQGEGRQLRPLVLFVVRSMGNHGAAQVVCRMTAYTGLSYALPL